MNVNLRLLKTKIELLWWVGGVDGVGRLGRACTIIFMPSPSTVLRLCCSCVVVVGVLQNQDPAPWFQIFPN